MEAATASRPASGEYNARPRYKGRVVSESVFGLIRWISRVRTTVSLHWLNRTVCPGKWLFSFARELTMNKRVKRGGVWPRVLQFANYAHDLWRAVPTWEKPAPTDFLKFGRACVI